MAVTVTVPRTMMKRLILTVTILLVRSSVRADDVDDELRKTVEAMNRNVPRALDSQARLDRVGYAPRELQFYCTLVNLDGVGFPDKKSALERELQKAQTRRVCTTPESRAIVDAGVLIKYLFYGRDSHFVAQFTVDSGDCQRLGASLAQGPTKAERIAPGTGTSARATPTPPEAKTLEVQEAQGKKATGPSKATTVSEEPLVAAGKQWTVKAGASYGEVMATLQDFKAVEKKPYGDYLDVTYRDPPLLTYPDAGGSCVLSFSKGKLSKCKGCDPVHFICASGL